MLNYKLNKMKTNKFKIGSIVKSNVNDKNLNILSKYIIIKETNKHVIIEKENGLFRDKIKWLIFNKDTKKLNFTKNNYVNGRTKNNFSYVTSYNELKNHPLVENIWSEGIDGMWLNTRTKEKYRDGMHYLHWWWKGTTEDGVNEWSESDLIYEFNVMIQDYNKEKECVLDTTW
jgi:hypothetical protein